MGQLRLWFESPVLFQPGDIFSVPFFLQYDIEDSDKNGFWIKFRPDNNETSIINVVFC